MPSAALMASHGAAPGNSGATPAMTAAAAV